jgi:hypothetical protein
MNPKEKILITGTGRCGTTFLIKLFSFLEFNTGYTKETYENFMHFNCNAGLERPYNADYYVLKNPKFIMNIENIIMDKSIKIKKVIIPIRDFVLSARSRVKHGDKNGGLWNAHNEESQIIYYKDIMTNYLYYMVKFEIPTIFIDFDRMVNDKVYLYNKLKCIFDEKDITFDLYSKVYDEVTITCKT